MIYTTYFSNLGNVPPWFKQISIARTQPKAFDLPEFKAFAPSAQLLWDYKKGKISWAEYEQRYFAQLEALPNLEKIKEHLRQYQDDKHDLVFVCWEGKNNPHCHRHLLARFFKEFNIKEL